MSEKWVKKRFQNKIPRAKKPVIFVANKVDLLNGNKAKSVASEKDILNLIKHYDHDEKIDIHFAGEISCKQSRKGVKQLFQKVIDIYENGLDYCDLCNKIVI